MAKVRQGQLTVTRATAGQNPAGREPDSSRRIDRTAAARTTRQGPRPRFDLDEVLLTLERRAPAPSVGPSHWWG
jgi:hypothetical protein